MDLTLNDEQRELVDLARRILSDAATPIALQNRDRAGTTSFDRALWANLADSGLLGVAVPEDLGGLGFGFLESCLLLEQVGRTTAPVPALTVLGVAVPVVTAFGTPAQHAELLNPVCAGSMILSAALTEPVGDPFTPAATATPDGAGWRLDGAKTGVPAGTEADMLLISADAGGLGPRLFVVAPTDPGVEIRPQPTVTGEVDARVHLDGVALGESALLGGADAADSVRFAVHHAMVASASVMAGVSGAALELTAEYVKSRMAFGRPLATFQAVGQRAADTFTAAWNIRLTALEAAWALADGRSAELEVLTAKYVAAACGLEVAKATQHLHGGIGLDADYPLHRFSAWAKRLELGLGGAGVVLERLGERIAAESVAL